MKLAILLILILSLSFSGDVRYCNGEYNVSDNSSCGLIANWSWKITNLSNGTLENQDIYPEKHIHQFQEYRAPEHGCKFNTQKDCLRQYYCNGSYNGENPMNSKYCVQVYPRYFCYNIVYYRVDGVIFDSDKCVKVKP